MNTPIPENARPCLGRSSAAMATQEFFEPVREELAAVQRRIVEQMHSPDQDINACLQVLSERPGKMLRPALLLLSGQAVGGVLQKEHINLAAMIEMVHMASLLHDDVIDRASLRRGSPSANALWGNTAAVLLGDFLLSRAFSLGAASRLDGAAALLGQTAQTLCAGELKQNLLRGRRDLTEAAYFQIIGSKTAALFSCCCRLGALAAGVSCTQEQALGDYGFGFGMAFQIADDMLDILSTEAQTGKTQGIDLKQEKWTLPVIHWFNQDSAGRQIRIEQWTAAKDLRGLIQQMRRAGSMGYALGQALRHVKQAKLKLDGFAQTPAKEALLSLADSILLRAGMEAV
ncbi:MAG: polyprenyl synthetase family protein [Planctomycetales bacterium]|nr:polyprenyl synthetase family protein [Planctomycetales bacterium]